MYNGVKATGGVHNGGLWWTLYFIFLVLFGNCIFLTLIKELHLAIINTYTKSLEQWQKLFTKRKMSHIISLLL